MQSRPNADARISAARTGAAESGEARLIGRIAEGDRHAFETLYRHYFPRLTRFLDRMMRSAQMIEEAVNDTMLTVWQKADTYDFSSKVSTWIFAIAYRKAMKALRSLDEPVDFDPDQHEDEAAYGPEQETAHRETQRLLAEALDALPAEQRAAVCLAYYHAMGYEEIADIMECPVNTVKTRMFHARHRLKNLLAGQMEDMP